MLRMIDATTAASGSLSWNRACPTLISMGLVLVIAMPPRSYGQSISWDWDGVSFTHWSLATNWNPQDVPDATNETATIGEAGTYTVQLNVSPTIQHLLITNPDATLDMWGSRTLTVTEANGVTNYGTILGDSASFIVGTLINHGTYESPGSINSIDGPITNEGVSPEGILIRGPSSLELYGPTVTNNGTIHINYNQYLGLSPTYLTFKATTVLDGTGEIIMDKYANLVTDIPSGAMLTQEADHTIRGEGTLGALLINYGTVRADNPDQKLLLDQDPKTNHGTFVADPGCRMEIFGTFEVTQGPTGLILADGGTVDLRSTSTDMPLTISGGTLGTLNEGVIHVNSGATKLIGVTVDGSLDVDYGQTVVVADGSLINLGTIRVDPTAHPSFTHFVFVEDGELSGPGELVLGRDFFARLFVDDGFVGTNGVDHTIRGEGLLGGEIVNNGTVAPGLSVGKIDALSGTTFTQGATGVLDLEVAGAGSSEYDRLTGQAAYVLDGTLRVAVVSPYEPEEGDAYTIISGTSVAGAFAAIEGPPPGPGLDWDVSYTASTVVLSVVQCDLAIDQAPQSQTVCSGSRVTLSARATGATGYQWRFRGTDIDGATSSSYFIPYALPKHSGLYDVVITSQCDTVTTDSASLLVIDGGSGDVNGDGYVDELDLQLFTEALKNQGPVDISYCAADITGDGVVDFLDVEPFVYGLTNP